MKNYRKLILNSLLESYEKSALFSGKNQRNQNIYFRFSKKTVPEYFEDTSVAYDEIHHELKALEGSGLIQIHWRNNKANHIVEKVSLNLEALEHVYSAVGRKMLQSQQQALKSYLCRWKDNSEIIENFIYMLEDRLDRGLSVKSYLEIGDITGFDQMMRGLSAVVNNQEECFIRELSMKLYGDSKKLESFKGKIQNIIVKFSPDRERFAHLDDIFLEFNVLRNPSIVMIKGDMNLLTGSGKLSLKDFHDGIGISSKDIHSIDFDQDTGVEQIITVENLTTYYRVREVGSLIIYLGGFHNTARRNLIWKAYKAFPKAKLFHWGDIDVGGFKIYFDLLHKTELPFKPMHMGVDTLKKYLAYTKALTKNDESELTKIFSGTLAIDEEIACSVLETLEWMLKNNCKLEQEIVSLPWK